MLPALKRRSKYTASINFFGTQISSLLNFSVSVLESV